MAILNVEAPHRFERPLAGQDVTDVLERQWNGHFREARRYYGKDYVRLALHHGFAGVKGSPHEFAFYCEDGNLYWNERVLMAPRMCRDILLL